MVRNLLMQFFTRNRSEMEVSGTHFFDIVATHNDHPSYIKHVSGSVCVFFPPPFLGIVCVWWLGGGSPNGLGHNLLMQFFTLYSSKIELSKTIF